MNQPLGVILAGGLATRMGGGDKALLTLGTDDIDVSITISSTGIGLVLGGVLMLMIGHSMYEATRMRQENEAFV